MKTATADTVQVYPCIPYLRELSVEDFERGLTLRLDDDGIPQAIWFPCTLIQTPACSWLFELTQTQPWWAAGHGVN